jgi:hypothetical protein
VTFNGSPGVWVRVTPNGLMVNNWTYMDRYSAAMWNQMTGRRAVAGNFNAPANLGWFINTLLPVSTRLVIGDQDGHRLPRARVQIFRGKQLSSGNPVPYGRQFGPSADLELKSDGRGEVLINENIFTSSPDGITHTPGFANSVVLIAVEKDGLFGYTFLPVSELNYEYLAGHPDEATIILRMTMR